jgi:hypothetical protein
VGHGKVENGRPGTVGTEPDLTQVAPRMTDLATQLGTRTRSVRHRIGCVPVLDGRSQAAKRIKALVAEYSATLGNPADPILVREIQSAAELTVIYERRRALALANDEGGAKRLDALIRFEGQLRRKLRALGLGDLPNRNEPPRPKPLQQQRVERADRILGVAPSEPVIDREHWEQIWADRAAIGGGNG